MMPIIWWKIERRISIERVEIEWDSAVDIVLPIRIGVNDILPTATDISPRRMLTNRAPSIRQTFSASFAFRFPSLGLM